MPKITTIGSHSSLQILKGAKDEGLETILITTKKQEAVYKELFPIADQVLTLNSYHDFFDLENYLLEQEAVIVPHGSFVAYVDQAKHEHMRVKYFGNKDVLKWEGDRHKQMEWLGRSP
jgi:5-formaminoimidazole-4-carboxamide-1-(beta)-D-ribofuranosyl 5'-monophosphate synthetase